MTTTKGHLVTLEMGRCGSSCSTSPDLMKVHLNLAMLQRIALALGALTAMAVGIAEVILPFDAPINLYYADDTEYDASGEDAATDGMFVPSSAWLQIQENTLAVEVWDEHGEDTLNGNVVLSDYPDVQSSLRAIRAGVVEDMLRRLAA